MSAPPSPPPPSPPPSAPSETSPEPSPSREAGEERTHFGYDEIATEEKAGRVQGIFRSVAGRYDLMNDLMSAGIHRLWKNRLVEVLAPRPGWLVADVAGGTGDVSRRILRAQPAAEVLVIDLTAEMLARGRDQTIDSGLLGGCHWLAGDAEDLPLPDRSVEAYTIAFGLRNVARPAQALAEARRVLKPGGRFLCLEFSRVVLPLLDRIYDLYSFSVLPRLGQVVAGDKESYRYLAESIRRFPPQSELARMMTEAGLARPRWENLSGGIAAIHSAWRV